MNSPRLSRRMMAVIAAYALALQGLVLAFVPAATVGSGGPFAALCSHDGGIAPASDPAGRPPLPDLPCAALCAMLGQGAAATVPTPLAVAAAFTPEATLLPAAIERPAHGPFVNGPQLPRGPPLG